MEVLHTKHMNARPPSAASLDTYTGRPPEIIPVDITDGTFMEVVGRLSEGAGLGGVRLNEPATLYPDIRGGKRRVATDGDGIFGVARKQGNALGLLPGRDKREADCTGQAARGSSGQGG